MKTTAFIATFAAALAIGSLCQPLAASPLSDLVKQQEVNWMMGSWATADGKVKFSYRWRLDKNAIGIKFEAGERAAEGMMALKPGSQEVHQVTVDNAGGVTTGQWIDLNGNPALKSTHLGERGEIKTVTEHIKVDNDTMKVRIYKQDDAGNAGDLAMEIEFKRQKAPPAAPKS